MKYFQHYIHVTRMSRKKSLRHLFLSRLIDLLSCRRVQHTSRLVMCVYRIGICIIFPPSHTMIQRHRFDDQQDTKLMMMPTIFVLMDVIPSSVKRIYRSTGRRCALDVCLPNRRFIMVWGHTITAPMAW